ncbi:MAG: hypothetical protein ABEJ73_02495 [Haloplanus sp.]
MDRRSLCLTVPLVALGGCVGPPRDGDGGEPPHVTDATLRDTGRCSDPETATVDVSESEIRVTGCVTGPNGCAVAALGTATVEEDRLDVVVTTERDAPPDVGCTQALVYRGYVGTVTVDGGRPATVRVVHDAPGARRTVTERPVDS